MRTNLACAVLVAVLAAAALAQAPADTVSGSFTVNGKAVALKHVYALVKPDPFDDSKDSIYIVLTDAPVTDKMLRDDFGLFAPTREGKLNAIETRLDENKSPANSQLYHQAFEGASVSLSGMTKLDLKFFDGKRIKGRLYAGPEDSFGTKWEFSADFSATIQPKPAAAAKTEAALDSPAAKVGLAFLKAAQAKDKAALKQVITADMAADLDGPHGAELLAMLPEMFPPTLKLTKVMMVGENEAELTFTAKTKDSSESNRMKAVKQPNGEWRISK